MRCWLSVYMPGSVLPVCIITTATDVHGAQKAQRSGSRDGSRTPIEKGSAKDSRQVLLRYQEQRRQRARALGNRAEAFGGPTIYLDPDLNEKMKGRKQFEKI
jgi:hypothetical protein